MKPFFPFLQINICIFPIHLRHRIYIIRLFHAPFNLKRINSGPQQVRVSYRSYKDLSGSLDLQIFDFQLDMEVCMAAHIPRGFHSVRQSYCSLSTVRNSSNTKHHAQNILSPDQLLFHILNFFKRQLILPAQFSLLPFSEKVVRSVFVSQLPEYLHEAEDPEMLPESGA